MSDGSVEPAVPVIAAVAIDAAGIAEPADAAGAGAVDLIDDADSAAAALAAAEAHLDAVVTAARKDQFQANAALGELNRARANGPEAEAAADRAERDFQSLRAALRAKVNAAREAVASARTRCEAFAKSPPVAAPMQRPIAATKAQRKTSLGGALPDHPAILLDLPYGLGALQRWISGRAKYPSPSTSGITALAVLGHLAMAHVTIASYGGLGLNEQWLILAPTGYGKEDLRSIFEVLDEHARSVMHPGANLLSQRMPRLQWSAPASPQAIHQLLQKHPAQYFLSDEFAEWLTQASTDSHKQMALAFFMEAYTKAHGTISAPHAVAREYMPIRHPRVGIFATSTAERMLAAMTGAQADSGSYNRFVIHVAEQDRIAKRYDGFAYDAPDEVLALVDWIVSLPATVVGFAPGAWKFFTQHDAAVIEPLRFSDNVLAARLSEQAIKMAALIALSDRRTAITANDLGAAFAIREGAYRRAATLIGSEGAVSGLHATGKALAQLTAAFARHSTMRRAWLPNYSRAYKALSAAERNTVVSALLADGTVTVRPDAPGMLFAGEVDLE